MAVKIRLSRIGKKHQPIYKVVVCDSQAKRDGKVIEVIGSYQPATEGKKLEIKKDRYQFWLEKGAQPTTTIRRLLQL